VSLSAHKPRVRYSDLGHCKLGEEAKVIPVDHPRTSLNGGWTTTTVVQHIQPQTEGPVFETRNTVYVPLEEEPEDDAVLDSEVLRDLAHEHS
jgi:hypothetical protein